jgi:hypothetical protein
MADPTRKVFLNSAEEAAYDREQRRTRGAGETHGDILPLEKEEDGSVGWALPQWMRDAWNSVTLPRDVIQGYQPTGTDVAEFGMNFGMAGGAASATFADEMGDSSLGVIGAWHGSPHDFDRFDITKIGSGEGAQVYGHGLYFAENPGISRHYKDVLSKKQGTHHHILKNNKGEVVDEGVSRSDTPKSGSLQFSILELQDAVKYGDYPTITDAAVDRIKQNERQLSQMRDSRKHILSTGETDTHLQDEWIQHYTDEIGRYRTILKDGLTYEYKVDANPGYLYQVDIDAEPDEFLDWDAPLSQQSPIVKEKLGPYMLTPREISNLRVALADQIGRNRKSGEIAPHEAVGNAGSDWGFVDTSHDDFVDRGSDYTPGEIRKAAGDMMKQLDSDVRSEDDFLPQLKFSLFNRLLFEMKYKGNMDVELTGKDLVEAVESFGADQSWRRSQEVDFDNIDVNAPSDEYEVPARVSRLFNTLGIKGTRYLDANSRKENPDKRYNYVIYDDKIVRIVGKE